MTYLLKINIAFVVMLFTAVTTVYGGPRQQRLDRAQQPLRPNAQRRVTNKDTQDIVQGFYVTAFQKNAEISPEVFAKMLPFIEQFVENRFEIAARRRRALNQLRQAINLNAPEDQLKRLVRELDAADSDAQLNQQKFFAGVDPLLNARQQARIRVIQENADARIRQLLNNLQNPPNPGQPNPPPQAPPNN